MARKKMPDEERVSVDRTEYQALTMLRDGAHEDLKLKHLALQNRYDEVIQVNKDQVNRLTRNMLEVEHARANMQRLEDRDRLLTDRVAKLEAELAVAKSGAASAESLQKQVADLTTRVSAAYPARFDIQQPAIGEKK